MLAIKGVETAALALPNRDRNLSACVAAKQNCLLQYLQGQLTPNNPESLKLFVYKRQQIKNTMLKEEYAFRIEQVLSVQVLRLTNST